MTNEFITRTNYATKPWTRAKTIITIAFFTLVLLLMESIDEGSEYSVIKYLVYAVLVFAFGTAPIDDIGVDKTYFYYFRTSILPFLSKTTKFEISKIKVIRAGGQYTGDSDVLRFLTMNKTGADRNTIEITLNDDSYRSLDVAIYKKDLQAIISKVKEQMGKSISNSQQTHPL